MSDQILPQDDPSNYLDIGDVSPARVLKALYEYAQSITRDLETYEKYLTARVEKFAVNKAKGFDDGDPYYIDYFGLFGTTRMKINIAARPIYTFSFNYYGPNAARKAFEQAGIKIHE